jgi:hypothetical protein
MAHTIGSLKDHPTEDGGSHRLTLLLSLCNFNFILFCFFNKFQLGLRPLVFLKKGVDYLLQVGK